MRSPEPVSAEPSARSHGAVSTAGVLRLLAVTGLVVALPYALADRLVESVLHWDDVTGQVAEIAFMAVLSSSVLWAGVLRPLAAQVARERQPAEGRQQQIETTASQQKFEASLHRALEMAATRRPRTGRRRRHCAWQRRPPTPS